MAVQVAQSVKQAAVSIRVTRADGRVEDLGVVGYYHRDSRRRRLRYALLRLLRRPIPEQRIFG